MDLANKPIEEITARPAYAVIIKGKMRDDIVKIGSGSNKDPQQSTGGPQQWE